MFNSRFCDRAVHLQFVAPFLLPRSRFYGVSRTTLSSPTAIAAVNFPDPKIVPSNVQGEQTAIFAGGCFWGVEAVFENLKGVSNVVSGFSGGDAKSARYDAVSFGGTGHAEAVKITYDPTQISYGQLLKVYFTVAHDPTQLNRQGPDVGTQYRSAVFFANSEQQQMTKAYIDQLNEAKVFNSAIVTQVTPLTQFYEAEAYHQDFIDRNPAYPYVVIHDLPKLKHLQAQFPTLYQNKVR
ncbi:MAG: peptide-methionine (S)-S-oxide reductase MsrA [Leptolyngbyaceae cyanobacterium CSU_1_4]|nr:peptide-methionine (S)-S-oxide reductase MsrA [Leptolyngbyaceae cyanobacterium CSU_1_4]